jgi:hypothetical protein
MPKFNLTIPHSLSRAEVMSRLREHLANAIENEFEDDIIMSGESWMDFSGDFSFMVNGYSISVSLQVRSEEVRINGKIPLVALPFRSQIKKDLLELGLKVLQA